MRRLEDLNIDIFADGADLETIVALAKDPLIKGFTTNPTLMRKAGVKDYREFARIALDLVGEKPISFEVLSDDFAEMERQARIIASWGPNVFVKIPVMNTEGKGSYDLIRKLSPDMQLNVTAIMTKDQVRGIAASLTRIYGSYLSLFCGRIADTGRDPAVIASWATSELKPWPYIKIIWASPREIFNVYQAEVSHCHAITLSTDLLAKRHIIRKDAEEYSRETVQQFHNDAKAAGYTL